MRAKQIMTQDVATIRGSASVAEAVRLMRLKGLRALIVEPRHSADAYGIVTVADIAGKVIAYGKDSENVRIYEIMSKPCITVDPDLDVEYVARLLSTTNLWCAPVIKGELLGVISITDIVSKGDCIPKPKLTFLRKELHKAISDARGISANYGSDSKRAIEAWDLVDELEVEACFYGLPKPDKSARELFADKPELVTV
ncbi:CBS domain containing membrane protein [Trichormus variabilis ATCC 29413]|uniref:CBS domain containing membrane protein n=2 Tax=Anabaena variabilis TaxID=264691 RepID=Q3M638_TRIV2|nr:MULTISPECIES: CBS domain-containing protein [Nostocaceae]ABA23548.1 CBS domain containing membrane protein [Trichormus variabilis ATCC 29413]MBC1217462.1 CBS domain-containing protein [Trichormus variabilis ARAD]MBC1256114.1 CBS domain-containing protein [Trichormus variabilis V5]MBC1269320.1 CBS domain-containing protein [Trichormus variabilis FSR]MBC1302814.1 CBS domain-containing protein [Trichormus variabilis N2B]